MTDKNERRLIATGIVGTVAAAFGWLDHVRLPALAVLVALTVYAVWRGAAAAATEHSNGWMTS